MIGAGITGAALSYELATLGQSVLLVDQDPTRLQSATRHSYGGLAFWSAATPIMQHLCQEGIQRYRSLADELDQEIEFRELDLVMPILNGHNPEQVAAMYQTVAIPPRLISTEEACQREPLLNPAEIAAALIARHGHIRPEATETAFTTAFTRSGGQIQIDSVTKFIQSKDRITGIKTPRTTYSADQIIACTGGLTRSLLQAQGISLRIYFTRSESIEIPTPSVQMQCMVMTAPLQRFDLEAESSRLELDPLWDESSHEPKAAIVDQGAIQFLDGSIRMGQTSRVLSNPHAQVDDQAHEQQLRSTLAQTLPTLANQPGHWRSCLVAFSHDHLPLVGAVPGYEGLHVFSGFSNPLMIVPPLARRFAQHLTQGDPGADPTPDLLLRPLSPSRWG